MIERILFLMESYSLTAKQLTDALQLPNSAVTEWKKGKSKPSTEAIIKIADYFSVSTDYLLGRTNLSKKEENIEIEENEKKIIEILKKLNERGKEEALKRVHELTYINNYVEASKKSKTRPTMIAAYGGDGVMIERTTKEEDEKTLEIMKKMKFRKE